MHQRQLHHARIAASVAATVISLACGTNYVYSAWAPQFAERLKLSATESNLIGLFGNLGMYSMGFPIGMFVDHRGPRPAVLGGALLLALGYFPLHQAYDKASGSVGLLCFYSYLTGLGGCMAFAAAVKTSALNWPHHRGTATAFPLAAFGLSAFFFSLFGSLLFPGDPSDFLLLLSSGTSGLTLLGFFFLKVYPHASYHAVPDSDGRSAHGELLRRTSSEEAKRQRSGYAAHRINEPGTSSHSATAANAAGSLGPAELESGHAATPEEVEEPEVDETSSLVSSSSSSASSAAGENVLASSVDMDRSHRVDIRGLALLRSLGFWQLFSIMALLAGIGLMTINNIGNDVKALWEHYDSSKDSDFLVGRQQIHVSILSIGSFVGRLLSGVGSDYLVKVLHVSRIWCLVLACFIFLGAQICALVITNPHFLGFVSGLSGLGYGFLFGVFPSIVAETFGIHGLSQNWGFMTMSPVISSNVFNLFYGATYDKHSVLGPNGERSCLDGLECYRSAYWVTFAACFVGIAVTLWVIRHQHQEYLRETKKLEEEED